MNKPKNEDFRKCLEKVAHTKGSIVSVFSDFVRMSACAVTCQTREEEYLQTIKSYQKEELEQLHQAFGYLVNEMQEHPFSDRLGCYYQEIASKFTRDSRGEFYTPEHISELMAKITVNVESVIAKGLPITVNEPTSGGGGMILQLAKQFSPEVTKDEKSYVDLLRVTAQDVSPIACDMSYLNTTLWGIPAQIILGNSLALTVDKAWKNIHWHRVGEDQRQAMVDMFSLLSEEPKTSKVPYSEPLSHSVSATPNIDLAELKQGDFLF